MELYIIRRAIAQSLDKENEFFDDKRGLTDEGRDRMREIAKGLLRLGAEFDLVLTSPLARGCGRTDRCRCRGPWEKRGAGNGEPRAGRFSQVSETFLRVEGLSCIY